MKAIDIKQQKTICGACDGEGKYPAGTCPMCNGQGYYFIPLLLGHDDFSPGDFVEVLEDWQVDGVTVLGKGEILCIECCGHEFGGADNLRLVCRKSKAEDVVLAITVEHGHAEA